MRILYLLTYYRPYLSGLSVAAERTAAGFVRAGHRVTVVCARHRPELSPEETLEGVRVVRVPIDVRLSKGALMQRFVTTASRLASDHDLVVLFLPAGPSEGLAALIASLRIPLVIEYICDIRLPGGFSDRIVEAALTGLNSILAMRASKVLVSSSDYAATSKFANRFAAKAEVVPLPVRICDVDQDKAAALRTQIAPHGGPVIGIAARLAADKGFHILLDAIPSLLQRFPDLTVAWAGESTDVAGENAYRERILPRIAAFGDRWKTLGVVRPDLANFFAACDVLVVPSVNRTESFGLVQPEAMLCGTPVVASDLPGVRLPVQTSGMGRLCRPGDPMSLVEAVSEVLANNYASTPEILRSLFGESQAVAGRLQVFQSLSSTLLERYVAQAPLFLALVRSVECELIQNLPPFREPSLDLGAGDGLFASVLKNPQLTIGLDPVHGALATARNRNAHEAVVNAGGGALPFRDDSLQTILANSVLEHIPDLDSVLRECKRVLTPGGRLVITTPSHLFAEFLFVPTVLRRLKLHAAAKAYGAWFNSHSAHFHTDSLERWRERLAENGFGVTSARYYLSHRSHGWFDLLHYLSVWRWVLYKVTGRYVFRARSPLQQFWSRFLRHVTEHSAEGPYLIIDATKRT